MHDIDDPISAALQSLRSQRWDRGEHQRQLEATLMNQFWRSNGRHHSWLRAMVITVLVLLAGGVAGASTMWLVQRLKVVETPGANGKRHVSVQEADGKTLFEDDLEEEEGLFAIDDEDGDGGSTILDVKPSDPPDEGGR
jgi:hypothetical protein